MQPARHAQVTPQSQQQQQQQQSRIRRHVNSTVALLYTTAVITYATHWTTDKPAFYISMRLNVAVVLQTAEAQTKPTSAGCGN